MSKRRGMFSNAKVSDRVFFGASEAVTKDIRNEVGNILKRKLPKPPPSDADLFDEEHAVSPEPYRHDSLRIQRMNEISKPIFKPSNNDDDDSENVFVTKKRKMDSEFMTAGELLRQRNRTETVIFEESLEGISKRRNRSLTTTYETPTVLKSPKPKTPVVERDDGFPSNVNMDKVAEEMVKGLPFLPLKNDDSTTYSQATNRIFNTALSQFFNLKDWTKKTDDEIEDCLMNVYDPTREMLNCTAPLNTTRRSLNSTMDRTLDETILTDEGLNYSFKSDLSLLNSHHASNYSDESGFSSIGNITKNGESSIDLGYTHEQEISSIHRDFDHIDRTLSADGSFSFSSAPELNNTFQGFRFADDALNFSTISNKDKTADDGSPMFFF